MRLSVKAENACLAAITMARQDTDQPVSVRAIAEAYGLSERFLIQIMLQLKAAGLVYSIRGPSGGYRLARPAAQTSLGTILDAIEGPEPPARSSRRSHCTRWPFTS